MVHFKKYTLGGKTLAVLANEYLWPNLWCWWSSCERHRILICRRGRATCWKWSTRSWRTTGSWRASGTPRRSSSTSASRSGSSKRMSSRSATTFYISSVSEDLPEERITFLTFFHPLSRCLTGLRSTVRFSCGKTWGSGGTWPRVEPTRRATRPSRASCR